MRLLRYSLEIASRASFTAKSWWYNGSFTPESAVKHVFSCDWVSPWQSPAELVELAAIVRVQRPRTMLEIGSAKGGTLFVWCQMADPEATVVSIDLPGGDFGGGYPPERVATLNNFKQARQKLHLFQANSHDSQTFDQVKKILADRKIQFLFVDGDHTYEGVRRDFEMYSSIVADGGIIGFHDIVKCPAGTGGEVNRFWDEVKLQFRHRELVEDRGNSIYGIGLLFL
jgi:predicted O-methyltransferase YrrM